MKILLLIPSVAKTEIDDAVEAGDHPRMDYYLLRDTLIAQGHTVVLRDYTAVLRSANRLVRFTGLLDKDAALALLGFLERGGFDAVFSNGENVAIPLAVLTRLRGDRIGHVTIGHRLSTGKKRLFFQRLRLWREIDTIFVYSALQEKVAREILQIPQDRLSLIPFHADTEFYRPMAQIAVRQDQICSAGLEWRDYPTLIRAVETIRDLSVRLAAASPWSKHTNETEKIPLPEYVTARRYPYNELRHLYAESAFVVVPLYENDFQAGVTTLLEAMAMGKAVIVTRTSGQTDVVVDGENGLYVLPGDPEALRAEIIGLRENSARRDEIGRNARHWVEKYATIEDWAKRISETVVAASKEHRRRFQR